MKANRTRTRMVFAVMAGTSWALVGGGHGLGPSALAQTSPAQHERQLREDLEKARQEIERLKEENARLRGTPPAVVPTQPPPEVPKSIPPAPKSAGQVPPTAAPPVTPTPSTVAVPAPVADGAVVSAMQLLADYSASAIGGDARYKGRRFRIEGTVRSFKKVFVAMGWDVHLEGQDTLGTIRCRVSFPGISDFRGEGASILEGRRPFREWKPLLAKGDKTVLEGVCLGMDDGAIVFRECRPSVAQP